MVEYLKQMSEIVSESSEKEQSEQALAAIVTEMKGKEGLIATDQKLSKVLERLIESNGTTVAIVKPIFSQLQGSVLELVYDQYGSHVFESVLKSISQVEVDEELTGIVTAFCESICSDMGNMMSDKRATFVVRSAALVFGGFAQTEGSSDLIEELKSLKRADDRNKFDTCFTMMIDAVSQLGLKAITELATYPHSSLTLQSLVLLADKVGQGESMVTQFLCLDDGSVNTDLILSYLSSPIKAKVVETAIFVANKGQLGSRIFSELMSDGRIFESKFAFGFLQSFVSSLKDVELMTRFVTEVMTPSWIRECVTRGQGSGIALIQRTVDSLTRLIDPQRMFVSSLLAAIRAEKNNIWMSLLALSADSFSDDFIGVESRIDESKITPQGCLLFSSLLKLKQSAIQPIVSGAHVFVEFLAKEFAFAQSRFMNEIGPGRLVQTMISADCSLPTGIKKKIIRHLMLTVDAPQRLSKMASDRKVGSWLVTAAWDCCAGDVETRRIIGDSLLRVESLRETNWKIWRHCGLATFSRRNDEWSQTEKKKSKAESLLRDIIGDEANYGKRTKY